MNLLDMASALRARLNSAGLSPCEVAVRADCSVAEVEQVLAGDPQVPVGLMEPVCEALGFVLVVVPRPAERAVAAGADVTEPKVETVVSASLKRLKLGAMAGKVQVSPDFDSPLPAKVLAEFESCEGAGSDSEGLSTPQREQRRREARRLALHQAAVRVLREQPGRADDALRTLECWVTHGFPDQKLAQEWRHIIECKRWDALLEDSEHAKRLRKGSPFICVVDKEERLRIMQEFARARTG